MKAVKSESFLKDCFWTKNIPIEYVEKFLKHSLCFGVYLCEKNLLVGFGRVISDYTTYAYVCDIIIDANHRRKGLASILIHEILSHPDLKGLKTRSLRTTEEGKKLYEKKGFLTATNPDTILEINDLTIYTKPDFINIFKSKN